MDAWTDGEAYEAYVGRWSSQVARAFIGSLHVPPGSRWLDVGCGTGALSEAILATASPSEMHGVDASDSYVTFARRRIGDERATFQRADARRLPFPNAHVDAAVSGLVLNFVPEPDQAVAEMRRVVRPQGVVAAYVWDYAGEMQLMRRFWDAAVALNASAADLDEGRRFPLCRSEALRDVFAAAGLTQVSVSAIDIETRFTDFEDYWSPFLGAQGPAPGYVASLDHEDRIALRDRVREMLPVASDGSITLVARALEARGRV